MNAVFGGLETSLEVRNCGFKLLQDFTLELVLHTSDRFQNVGLTLEVCVELRFEAQNVAHWNLIQVAFRTCPDRYGLLFGAHWFELALLEKLGQSCTTVKLTLGCSIEV